MPDENKERTLEVVNLPPEVDQELLALYFANKRRSGGGPLVSVEKMGDRAVVVFEETEGELQQYVMTARRISKKEIKFLWTYETNCFLLQTPPNKNYFPSKGVTLTSGMM